MSEFQKPYFILQRFDPDGSFEGTSYFYERLGGEQMESMMKEIPCAIIRRVHSTPETIEIFILQRIPLGASDKGFSATISRERADAIIRQILGLADVGRAGEQETGERVKN